MADEEEYADGEFDHQDEEFQGWGEISAAPVQHADTMDSINCLRFDAIEESLWVGTGSGMVVQDLCPTLERYSAIAAHEEAILSIKSAGESAVSLSPSQLCLHCSGCVPRVSFVDEVSPALSLSLSLPASSLHPIPLLPLHPLRIHPLTTHAHLSPHCTDWRPGRL